MTVFTHFIKRINFLNREVSICLQNLNGPCPLLGIVNVLLLRNAISLPGPKDRESITSEELVGLIGDYILDKNPVRGDSAADLNLQKTIQDVMDILPSLQEGLDVNVRFTGVKEFEYDSRISVFDLLDINLFHGWVIDPQDEENIKAVGDLSYNQLLDKMVTNNDAGSGKRKTTELTEAMQVQSFLADTASQLTYWGLLQLHEIIKERELCVFFRNNHFSTVFKINGNLYILLTDQGYRFNNQLAWEQLSEIDGNTDLVSPEFGNPNEYVAPKDLLLHVGDGNGGGVDELLAKQLQAEENKRGNNNNASRRGEQQRQNDDNKSGCKVC